MGNVDKAKQIANTLSNEQIVYLHIANDIWGSSVAMESPYIEDIEATGGVFDDDNTLGLVYVDGEFDNAHVNEVISKWKNLHDNDGEMIEDMSTLQVLDEVLSDTALIDDFQNVQVTVYKDTGSSEDMWKAQDKDSVEIIDILMQVDEVGIVDEFLGVNK